MATNQQGILGGFSGKVGTVIGGEWKGIDFIKSKPAHIANPRTEAQQVQRVKMVVVIKFLSPLKAFLRVGFKKQAIKMTAFNVATSYNLAHAIIGTYPEYRIDYSKVMVSQGKLPGALDPGVNSPANGQVKFTWADNSSLNGAMGNDGAVLLVYDPEKGLVFTSFAGSVRGVGTQIIQLPANFKGDEVQCYIAFQNASQTVISDSQFAGSILVK